VDYYLVPVINGVLPRPGGGEVTGVFLDPLTAKMLAEMGAGSTIVLCPYDPDEGSVYPAGVLTRILSIWVQDVFLYGPQTRVSALFARVLGEERVRPSRLASQGNLMIAVNVKKLDVSVLRSERYPVIDGAGWQPIGGNTEMKSLRDLPVTIYGIEFESGRQVDIEGNVGGVVTPEQAHTIEHAIIRALQSYAMCTPKTLARAIAQEGRELASSVELGYKMKRPEVFGVTSSGACGNPMTNLAHFYLAREMVEGIESGRTVIESLEMARRRALSQLTEELELTSEIGLRTLQGLKKGMLHDDNPLAQKYLKRVLNRFPASPWH
jgi:hypothetical protein